MDNNEFINFLNAGSSRGGSTFNLKTSHVSSLAQQVLKETPYKMLAKQHINANVVKAYYNNTQFKNKLNDVMSKLGIAVIA